MNEAQMNDIRNKFELHPAPPVGALHSFSALELTDREMMRAFVDSYGPLMKALEDKAVAAYFANWLSSLALAVQYSISLYHSAPDFTLSNLWIHLVPANGYCRVVFSLREWGMDQAPADEKGREVWRVETLTRLYSETVAPLLRCMSEVSGLGASELWGQLPTKFNYYVKVLAEGIDNEKTVDQLHEDYRFLMNDLPGEVFGLSRNPFKVTVRNLEDPADPQRTVQMRNRCCWFYRTEGGSYCYTCPRLKEEERAARRAEFRKPSALANK